MVVVIQIYIATDIGATRIRTSGQRYFDQLLQLRMVCFQAKHYSTTSDNNNNNNNNNSNNNNNNNNSNKKIIIITTIAITIILIMIIIVIIIIITIIIIRVLHSAVSFLWSRLTTQFTVDRCPQLVNVYSVVSSVSQCIQRCVLS